MALGAAYQESCKYIARVCCVGQNGKNRQEHERRLTQTTTQTAKRTTNERSFNNEDDNFEVFRL